MLEHSAIYFMLQMVEKFDDFIIVDHLVVISLSLSSTRARDSSDTSLVFLDNLVRRSNIVFPCCSHLERDYNSVRPHSLNNCDHIQP